jgi:hypothetical protein
VSGITIEKISRRATDNTQEWSRRVRMSGADARKTGAKIVLPMVHPSRHAFLDAASLHC